MHWGPIHVKMQQKLKSIVSLAKKQSQYHDKINNKFTVFKKQNTVTLNSPKPKKWAEVTFFRLHLLLYNKRNEIVVMLKTNI